MSSCIPAAILWGLQLIPVQRWGWAPPTHGPSVCAAVGQGWVCSEGAELHSGPGVTYRGPEGTWPQMGPHLGALLWAAQDWDGAGGTGSTRSDVCIPFRRASRTCTRAQLVPTALRTPPQPSCTADVTTGVAQPRRRQLMLHTHTTRPWHHRACIPPCMGCSGVRVPPQPLHACVGRVLRCLAVSRRPRGREVVGWGCHPPRPPLAALISPTHAVPRAEPLI